MLVLRNYEFLIHFAGTFQSSSGEYLVPICYAACGLSTVSSLAIPSTHVALHAGSCYVPVACFRMQSAVENFSCKLLCMPCIRTIRWPNGASSDQSRGRRDIEALRIDVM